MDITDLWNSLDESAWVAALKRYWDHVRPENLTLEHTMDELDIERLRDLNPHGWYAFLRDEYCRWKYTAPHRYATATATLRRYENGGLDELDTVRQALLQLDPNDVRAGLATARRIWGLGTAGASGLLALIYPATFATSDQFVVRALREVKDLPEQNELQRMNPEDLTEEDGVTLIRIMQRKAAQLHCQFGTAGWTPRKIDMILRGSRQRRQVCTPAS